MSDVFPKFRFVPAGRRVREDRRFVSGKGESGHLGAPAAIASAINDALAPLGIAVNALPIKMTKLADMIAAANAQASS